MPEEPSAKQGEQIAGPEKANVCRLASASASVEEKGSLEKPMSAGMPTKVSQHLIDQTILFPTRMGRPDEFAGLVRHIVENAYLNATTISIDAGTRVGTR